MADRKITMSRSDIDALADRCLARATSRLLEDQPALRADLRLAGRLLQRLLALVPTDPIEFDE
jgi:hypothetical protein